LIVDDHPVVRVGLAAALELQPELELCGEAASMAEALQQVEATGPDLVIVDLCLGHEDGIELIEQIKARWPQVRLLAYSFHDERDYAGRVLRAGATGYLGKRAGLDKIAEAVRDVLRGDIYLSPPMTARLLQEAALGRSLDDEPEKHLSHRELQVFELFGRGLPTLEIARQLRVSPKTVESHRKQIKEKMNFASSAQMNHAAFRWLEERRMAQGHAGLSDPSACRAG
jgi:DNA-binding NarL/FixJ family response regulator